MPGGIPDLDNGIDFENVKLKNSLICNKFLFPKHVNFERCIFEEAASFNECTFVEFVSFTYSEFARGLVFSNTVTSSAYFGDVWFKEYSTFDNSVFLDGAYFAEAEFHGLRMCDSEVIGETNFWSAKFKGYARFERTKFRSRVDFSKSEFHAGSVFTGCEFGFTTLLSHTDFKNDPPEFYQAKVHEDFVWPNHDNYPTPVKDDRKAADHGRAYDCLRKLARSLEKFDEEQFFLAQKFRCQEVGDGFPRNLASKAYGYGSGYGTSMGRPAMGLLGVVVGGWLLLGLGFLFKGSCPAGMVGGTGTGCMWSSLQVSLANTFPFLGAGRSILEQEIEELIAFDWYEWLAMSQTVLGPVFLFFLLMGMRNRFRMR